MSQAMPKTKSKKPESVKQAVVAKRLQGESKRQIARDLEIHRATVDNILDDSQIEASLEQWRKDYFRLVPKALVIVGRMLDQSESTAIDRDMFFAALQVLKGTGVHEERTRSQNNVKISQNLTNVSDSDLDNHIAKLLATPQPPTKA